MHVTTRPSLADARGFSMVELLVVLLILGILAMIALPAFIGQRMKGQDTEAQVTLRNVATALATYHTNEDTYDATRAQLTAIEPSIGKATADLQISGDADSFTIRETSVSGTEFTMARSDAGVVTRSCSIPDRGLCASDSSW